MSSHSLSNWTQNQAIMATFFDWFWVINDRYEAIFMRQLSLHGKKSRYRVKKYPKIAYFWLIFLCVDILCKIGNILLETLKNFISLPHKYRYVAVIFLPKRTQKRCHYCQVLRPVR